MSSSGWNIRHVTYCFGRIPTRAWHCVSIIILSLVMSQPKTKCWWINFFSIPLRSHLKGKKGVSSLCLANSVCWFGCQPACRLCFSCFSGAWEEHAFSSLEELTHKLALYLPHRLLDTHTEVGAALSNSHRCAVRPLILILHTHFVAWAVLDFYNPPQAVMTSW